MKSRIVKLGVTLLILGLVNCSEIFVEDISEREVTLVSPVDSLVTDVVTIKFWWEEVEDAENYNLQVVHPDFENPSKILLDTNLTRTQFSYALFPGIFQWRVKAYNSAYETEYTARTLVIDSTADLSNTQVILNSPQNNLATTKSVIDFQWQKLYNAGEYRFILKEKNWQGAYLFDTTLAVESQVTLTLNEGFYAWGVKALNGESETSYEHRELAIDYTAPEIPALLNPNEKDTINTTLVTFQWRRPDRSGTEITDSLIIATDSTFNEMVLKRNNRDTIYNWNPTGEESNIFYWKVGSVDRAGNKSDYSNIRSFYRDEK